MAVSQPLLGDIPLYQEHLISTISFPKHRDDSTKTGGLARIRFGTQITGPEVGLSPKPILTVAGQRRPHAQYRQITGLRPWSPTPDV